MLKLAKFIGHVGGIARDGSEVAGAILPSSWVAHISAHSISLSEVCRLWGPDSLCAYTPTSHRSPLSDAHRHVLLSVRLFARLGGSCLSHFDIVGLKVRGCGQYACRQWR